MKIHNIIVPSYLKFEKTLEFINTFKSLRENRKYIFDFKNLIHIDPFSLLCLSSEIALFKRNNPNSEFCVKNHEHRTYEAHMGFFQSFGVKYGKETGEANNNNNYIPITLYSVKEIKQEAQDLVINPAELLTKKSKEISTILTRNSCDELKEVLTFCIREIFRNIVEHSKTDKFGFCAQFLPTKNKVIFSVLDTGIGIKESLSENPLLSLKNDLEAIYESLKPGISGKVYEGSKKTTNSIDAETWRNSGYGLYMTSNICKNGGEFFIASKGSGLILNQNSSKNINLNITGTALTLTIDTNSISNLNEMLKDLNNKVSQEVKIKPSKSSMNK